MLLFGHFPIKGGWLMTIIQTFEDFFLLYKEVKEKCDLCKYRGGGSRQTCHRLNRKRFSSGMASLTLSPTLSSNSVPCLLVIKPKT